MCPWDTLWHEDAPDLGVHLTLMFLKFYWNLYNTSRKVWVSWGWGPNAQELIGNSRDIGTLLSFMGAMPPLFRFWEGQCSHYPLCFCHPLTCVKAILIIWGGYSFPTMSCLGLGLWWNYLIFRILVIKMLAICLLLLHKHSRNVLILCKSVIIDVFS